MLPLVLLIAASVPPAARTFLDRHCVSCHHGEKAAAKLDLSTLEFAGSDRWVRVHDMVREGKMPPAGVAVGAEARAGFLKALAGGLVEQQNAQTARQGRSVLRRLNRYEYENTLRDLFQAPWLQLKDSLPEDGILERFNKVGQALDVSHVQMARYLETAEDALRAVMKAASTPLETRRYYARDQKRLQARMRYTVFNRHPERASIPILGFTAQPEVLEEKAPFSNPATREEEAFATPASTYIGNEYHFDQFTAPAGGRYKIRFNAYSLWIHTLPGTATKGTRTHWRPDRTRTERGRTTEPVTLYAFSKGGKRLLGTFDVSPEPGIHELTVDLVAGDQILPDAARLFRSRPGFIGSPEASAEGMPGVAYRWMEVSGPSPTPAVEKDLKAFLTAAYRRPVRAEELARYRSIAEQRGSLAAMTAILCSPGFLYFDEKPGALDGWALANRLSYFLWNSAPDAALRKLAADGTLLQPEVLRAQTNRLLDDPRSRRFTDAFLDYWLDLRKLNDTTPDVTLYPDYYLDDLLTESATAETQLYFAHLLGKNLPARFLVESDFTMLNSHLARHYGLPPVEGSRLAAVKLPAGSVRGGLLTQASVLKVTANGTTTSPVLRGAWMMERIVGRPPSPPPPGVPAVEPDTRGATTIRQQLDKHRSVAACAACHRTIDPPGFALESFDILGGYRARYRSTDEGERVSGLGKNGHDFAFRLGPVVDASGEYDGKHFADVIEFKRLLAADERQLARNLVRQWVTYSTGAPVSFADRAAVERILDRVPRYGVRSLLEELVQSPLFRNK